MMPGLMILGLGIGLTMSPLNRYVLFVTPVAKGTASALMSMIDMSIIGLSVAAANYVYKTYNFYHLTGYYGILGLVYFTVIGLLILKHDASK